MKFEIEVPDTFIETLPNDAMRTRLISSIMYNAAVNWLHPPPGREDPLTGFWSWRKFGEDLWDAMFQQGEPEASFNARYLCLYAEHSNGFAITHGEAASDRAVCELAGNLRALYPDAACYRNGGGLLVDLDARAVVVPAADERLGLRSCVATFAVHQVMALNRRERTWQRVAYLVYRSMDYDSTPEGCELLHEWDARDS